jgi:hypothetical protein
MDHLRLVEAVDGPGQGIVMGIADAAHGRLNPRFGQTLRRSRSSVIVPSRRP